MIKLNNTLNKKLDKLFKKYKSVGTSVVLFDNNEIKFIRHNGFINSNKKVEVSDNSMFMIGSNTKVLTSLSIFQLLEQNKISLNDDIKKYIPELNIKSLFDYDKITIENLLMHRSGIQCDLYDYIMDDKKEYHDIIKGIEETYLTIKPGTMFAYSNIGYTLLGIIIERVSGMLYVDYIKENIAKPLNIDVRFLSKKEEFDSNTSLSYDKKHKETKDLVATMIPAGSNTYMKITDLVKVGQMFLNEGQVNGNVFLKKETIELMKKLNLDDPIDQEANNGGYGLLHNSESYGNAGKVYGHGGDTLCHHSSFSFIPKQNIGAITFTNTEDATTLSRIASRVCIEEYLKFKGIKVPKYLNKYKYIKTDLKQYVGEYATIVGLLNIQLNDRGELVSNLQGLNIKLIPCEDGYLQAFPNLGLIKNLLLKNIIKNIRFKFVNYKGENVVVLEQIKNNQKGIIIIGSEYIYNKNNDSLWNKAVGEYQIQNMNISNSNMKLINENGKIKIHVDLDSEKIIKYLYVINDNLAFSQGFGRDCKEACFLEEKEDGYYLKCSGVVGKMNK